MAPPRKNYALFVLGQVLRLLGALFLLSVMAFMVWRVLFSGRIPQELRRIQPNETLRAAYEACGGELTVLTQEQSSITKNEESYGYFAVPRAAYLTEAGQYQVLLRYNNSTLRAVEKDFSLKEELPRGVPVFDVALCVITDLTPENKEDNVDGSEQLSTRYVLPADHRIETTALYTYVLYTFDGVGIADDTIAVFFDVFYPMTATGEPAAGTEPIGTLRLYHTESEDVVRALTDKERRAIEEMR